MAEGYISDQVCACGCDTFIPQHLVNRGWRYLRGHKPEALRPRVARAGAKRIVRERMPGPSPVLALSYERMAAVVVENVKAAAERLRMLVDKQETAASEMKVASERVEDAAKQLDREKVLAIALRHALPVESEARMSLAAFLAAMEKAADVAVIA